MWCWGLQEHRWGKLEEPAEGTWVVMHRASDVGVDILVDLHTPTGATATVVRTPGQSGQAGSGAAMTMLRTCWQGRDVSGLWMHFCTQFHVQMQACQ